MNNTCALLVIDMQNGFINEKSPCYIKHARETVPTIAKVVKNCKSRGIPVFYVTRNYDSRGLNVEHTRYESWRSGDRPMSTECASELSADMPEELAEIGADYYITKPRFSAFFHTELDLVLRRLGINTVIITGTTTPNCIRATCYDGISLEYNAVIIEDCTSSSTEEIQTANIHDMKNIGAQIISSKDFINGADIYDNVAAVRKSVFGQI